MVLSFFFVGKTGGENGLAELFTIRPSRPTRLDLRQENKALRRPARP
jgi:hypothetical protein